MSGTRAISTTSRRELSSSFPPPLQGKAPKEIHAILTETVVCFLSGPAKDLSAPLYFDTAIFQPSIQFDRSVFRYTKIDINVWMMNCPSVVLMNILKY